MGRAAIGADLCYSTDMTKAAHAQSIHDRTRKAGQFAQEWVSSNVINVPGLDDLPREVERLAIQPGLAGFLKI